MPYVLGFTYFCLLLGFYTGEDDDSRYTGPNALQLLKATPLKFFTPPSIEGVMKQVLCDLLNALAVPNDPKPVESNTGKPLVVIVNL